MVRILSVAFFILIITALKNYVIAQKVLVFTGSVTSVGGMPIEQASVVLIAGDSTTILTFTSTNEKGTYSLAISQTELQQATGIKVSSIGYKPQLKPLITDQTVYDFSLNGENILLKDVIVPGGVPKIKMNGDTTTYRVKDFAGVQDRTIGDVLKRIPGITVENNGQIRFNDKTVSKLYLDGDDLLYDKYNIGTRTIPQNLVNEIQVLENHQTIKALEGKIFSDEVDINLTFNAEAALKIVGEVQVGAGVPNLYDEDVNALSLKKQYKAIDELKLNDVGNLLSNDIISYNDFQNYRNRGYIPEQPQLSTGTGSNPAIDQNRYSFNNSGLLNSANLWKLQSGMQIKSLIYYESDEQVQNYQGQTTTYLPDDIINYTESQNNKTLAKNAYGNIVFQINKYDYYLNNALIFKYKNGNDNSYLLANQQPLKQNYMSTVDDIANELKIIEAPKGKLFTEYYSYLNYRYTPEQLLIDSGTYPAIFNTSLPLYSIKQQVNIPVFYINNYVTFHLVTGNIVQSYKMGASAKLQNFDSNLQAVNTNNAPIIPDSANNALRWHQLQGYAESNYEWRSGYLLLTAKFPVLLQQIKFNNNDFNQTRDNIIVNPFLSFRYDPVQGIAANFFYLRSNDAGNLLQSYNDLVLDNYRSISQNDRIFSITQINNLGILLTYKNPVKIFFVNLSGNYSTNLSNNIAFNSINKQLSYTGYELYNNLNKTFDARLAISKYIYNINATINLSFSFQVIKTNQLINNAVFPFVNTQNNFSAGVTGSIGKKIRYNYNVRLVIVTDKPKENIPTINSINNSVMSSKMELEYNITDEFNLKAVETDELSRNNNGLNVNYNFINFSAKYRLIKLKTDLQLEASNLTNIKNYQAITLSSNVQNNYQYPLRGKLVMMKAIFIF